MLPFVENPLETSRGVNRFSELIVIKFNVVFMQRLIQGDSIISPMEVTFA